MKGGTGGRGGGDFEVSQLCVGNFAFQIGREISHAKPRGFCEISRTLVAETVDSGVPLSKFKHMSGPENIFILITGRVWQMGLPCIVSGTCG